MGFPRKDAVPMLLDSGLGRSSWLHLSEHPGVDGFCFNGSIIIVIITLIYNGI